MESQRQDDRLDLLILAVVIIGLVLIVAQFTSFTTALLAVFVGFAYIVFTVVVLAYTQMRSQERDQPTINMKKVVSLGRRCPEAATDDVVKCLAERLNAKMLFAVAGLPAVTAILMMPTHSNASLFMLTNGLYVLTLAASFLVVLIVHGYVASMHQRDVQNLLTHISGMFTFAAYSILFFKLMAKDPNIFIDKTYVQDVHTAHKRFVEDLDEECQPEISLLLAPVAAFASILLEAEADHLQQRRKGCGRSVGELSPHRRAYDLIFYRRDLELARRLMEILRNRNLDEKERAAFQVLEVAYEAAANPPCGDQEALKRYAERLNGIHTPGWSFLLKISTQMHLSYADPCTSSATTGSLAAQRLRHC